MARATADLNARIRFGERLASQSFAVVDHGVRREHGGEGGAFHRAEAEQRQGRDGENQAAKHGEIQHWSGPFGCRPGLGVEVDFRQLEQIAEWTEPDFLRGQLYYRPDGSITNW